VVRATEAANCYPVLTKHLPGLSIAESGNVTAKPADEQKFRSQPPPKKDVKVKARFRPSSNFPTLFSVPVENNSSNWHYLTKTLHGQGKYWIPPFYYIFLFRLTLF
jgi:hypothetical protein